MGYSKETFKGLGWVGGLRGVTRFISFIKIVVLARILTPAQFGVYGVANLFLSFLEILTETGINVFLIQEEESEKYIGTAWVVSILRGILISFFVFLLASPVSYFFNSPESMGLIRLIAIAPLIRGFINPSISYFQKDLRFAADFRFRSIILVVDGVIAVFFAIATGTTASIVYGLIAGALVEVVLSYFVIKPWPSLTFKYENFKRVVGRGKWLTGAGIFQYFFRQGDDVVVGRLLGEGALGYYQMAYKFATLPLTEVAEVFGKVTLPIYVKISTDKKRLLRAFYKTSLGLAVLALLFFAVLIFFSYDIVSLILGERWLEIVPTIRILAVYALIRSIINPSLTTFLAIKKQEYLTYVNFLGIVVMFLTILPLAHFYGINGVAWSTVIASVTTIPVIIFFLRRVFRD